MNRVKKKNPLIKRIPKELIGDIWKYIVLFLFMTITIGFMSGYLIANSSMVATNKKSYDKYHIEDGNFELNEKAEDSFLNELNNSGVTIYENTYVEKTAKSDKGSAESTLRIFKNREQINLVCVMKGKIPTKNNEIAIDRLYAKNNHIKIDDEIYVGEEKFRVTGFVALSDYSAMFEDNNDMMFEDIKFGVAVVTSDSFSMFDSNYMHYSYSWKYAHKPENKQEEKEMSDAFMKVLYEKKEIKQFIPSYQNQSIHYAGDDIGKDKSLMLIFLYILTVILAFIFAVTTSNTISKEACVIGTLRASGYTRGEVITHYLTMPLLITIFASIVGNIMGYTFFKKICASLYYNSYSLPKYQTKWNAEAFVLTTVIPFFIMLLINFIILKKKLNIEPLMFIKNNLSKKKKKAVHLPDFKFFIRFRIRIIFQNIPAYLMLFIGILFANVLLLFGMIMNPLLTHYKTSITNNKIANYQYVLKTPVETQQKDAEKYAITSLITTKGKEEEISVIGVMKDSSYVDISFKGDGVWISDGYAEKYNLKKGDKIKLKEEFGNREYQFVIDGVYEYPAELSVFMDKEDFCNMFGKNANYFNGYFSDNIITDIKQENIAVQIGQEDLMKMYHQMKLSLGGLTEIINTFSVILYVLLIFLLSKIVIEKNTNSISMVKILGYENKEIKSLYLTATKIVVLISQIITIPIASIIIKNLYHSMMLDFKGWLSYYIKPVIYVEMFIIGIVCYLVLEIILYQRIRKIPMDEALKNVE